MARRGKPFRDPIKARAGRLGARATAMRQLRWLRQLIKIRGGTFARRVRNPVTANWRLNVTGVVWMYVLLYRSTGQRQHRTGDMKILKLLLPYDAAEELRQLNDRCDTGLSLRSIEKLAHYNDKRFHGQPDLITNEPCKKRLVWTYRSDAMLDGMLRVDIDEQVKLAPLRQPKPRQSRMERVLDREDKVSRAYWHLRRTDSSTSVTSVQETLVSLFHLKLSRRTVWGYLKNHL